jgi:2-keto-4-pentenoate hydratase/2-oxohepta-3-ene-1,7-dioic acid hydratase in catechol pathway
MSIQLRVVVTAAGICALLAGCMSNLQTSLAGEDYERGIVKYARFRIGDVEAYGIVQGDRVYRIEGDLFGAWKKTDEAYALEDVTLLAPTRPSKVLALAGSYLTHLGEEHPRPDNPEVFFKVPSCIIGPGESIVHPSRSSEVHLEAEMVIVIGKRAKNVSEEKAMACVLGVTCGNDISARDWQENDRQWWRAKGTDTFGPCGPFIVSGIDYDDLLLQSRLNGKVIQSQRTSDLLFNVAEIVSWISRHVTLEPGDLV